MRLGDPIELAVGIIAAADHRQDRAIRRHGYERRLADQFVPQYPWAWSAGILAGLLGLSVCTLSARVKSLDRLR